jgi:hypothetical protein
MLHRSQNILSRSIAVSSIQCHKTIFEIDLNMTQKFIAKNSDLLKSVKLQRYPLPASFRTPTILTDVFRGSPQSFRENIIESLIRPQDLNTVLSLSPIQYLSSCLYMLCTAHSEILKDNFK